MDLTILLFHCAPRSTFFNVRELLHLMGLPHDFEIEDPVKNVNHLCQNVPVNTAKDWAKEVVRFCRNEAEMTNYTFLRQDNTRQTITDSVPPQKNTTRTARKRGYQESLPRHQAHQKFHQKFVKFNSEILEDDNGDIFQCGLCHYRTTKKIDLNDHWLTDCKLQSRTGVIYYKRLLCSGCGVSAVTTDDLKTHWKSACSAFVKQKFGQMQETNLMAGTYKQQLDDYQGLQGRDSVRHQEFRH